MTPFTATDLLRSMTDAYGPTVSTEDPAPVTRVFRHLRMLLHLA